MAHVLQGLCELDGQCTVTSMDGISAYDLVSRVAMFESLQSCSTDPLRHTCGKTPMEWSTPSGKAKEGSKVTPSCRSSSVWGNEMREGEFRIHGGKTQVWNQGGVKPQVCDVLERIRQRTPMLGCGEDPKIQVWSQVSRGSRCWALHWALPRSWNPSWR